MNENDRSWLGSELQLYLGKKDEERREGEDGLDEVRKGEDGFGFSGRETVPHTTHLQTTIMIPGSTSSSEKDLFHLLLELS